MDESRDTDPTNIRNPIAVCYTLPEDRGRSGDYFAAPLDSLRSGLLQFTNGAYRTVIRASSQTRDLCHARFGDRMPTIREQRGVVILRYPRVPFCDWLNYRSECPTEVELNPSIPWEVEVRGGASRLCANLHELRLGSLTLDGGASRLEVVLPAPVGVVSVVLLGGACNVAIRRPEGVAAQLRVGGGATNLKFDDRRIGAAGGELDLRDRDYDGAADCYDVALTGGANNVSIDKQPAARGRGSGTWV